MPKIFISHSSKYAGLVDRFSEFLQMGMNLHQNDIFCTSMQGTLPTGEDFITAIKNSMAECKATIFLLTEAYMDSPFCLAELGAAWALGQTIFPLVVPPLTFDDIRRTPISGRQCLKLDSLKGIEQLGTDFLAHEISTFNLAVFNKYAQQFVDGFTTELQAQKKEPIVNLKVERYLAGLSELTKSDDAARFLLGTIYWEGILVPQDNGKAAELLRQAAENGYAPAQYKLSSMYYKGEAGTQSFEEAYKWDVKAAKGNNPLVWGSLGFLYRSGLGCKRDLDQAKECYRRAIELGGAGSYSTIAEIYAIHGEIEQAIDNYTKSVESGYTSAAYSLGILYKEGGKAFSPDYVKAANYFKIAADAGMTEAKYQLGQLYYMGYAVFERDFKVACKWFREAAEEGDMLSQYNLGYAYHHGLGVEQNWDLAVHWYEQGARRGHQLCQIDVADLYAQADHQDYDKAIYWYTKAAEQNSSEAHRKLGDMYYFGIGCEIDQIKAINHYAKAAEQKEYIAQLRLNSKI